MRKISPKTKHIIKNVVFAVLGVGALIFGGLLIWISTIQLPDFSSFDSRIEVNSSKVYDRTGTVVLYDLGSDVHRTTIPTADIGANIKNATVAIEDSNFYSNHGIEVKSMVRAALADITHVGVVQGGSTITQQVIKNSLLSDDKTVVRKLKEVILALKLDREYSKDDILGIYLNEIPYGGNIFGVQEASEEFFGKAPADLDLAQAAYLASIPNAPTHYSPYGQYRADLDARKNLVLEREHTLGFITDDQYAQAKAEVVTFLPQQSQGIKAPHFVFYIEDYLEQKYGVDAVESGGLKIITTLDWNLQQEAEAAVTEYTLGDKKQIPDENAGLVAIDPKTGQILAMVGSRNYFDTEIDGNFNVTTAERQPGSSFKPFVYATAFKDGYTPETMLWDVPTDFTSSCDAYGNPLPGSGVAASTCYMPNDFDNKFRGPISVRDALARSLNIPAVHMLYMVGIPNAIKTAQDMGITTLTDPSRYGLSLVLGGGEVKLLEMTSAYGTFAAEGVHHAYSGVLSVTDKDGKTLESWQDSSAQALPTNVALNMTDILDDNVARTPTFGANSALYFPGQQVAVKTGTTNDYKDSWSIGYTPSLVAGVWIGKNDDTAMPASVGADSLWHAFMVQALKGYPNETFDKPVQPANYDSLPPVLRGYWEGNESFKVDSVSGQLATPSTPAQDVKEYVVTDVHDLIHWVNKTDPTGPPPTDPESDPLYSNFETAVQNWWAANKQNYPIVTESMKPTGTDTVHTSANAPKVTITSPGTDTTLSQETPITVSISYSGAYPLQKLDVYLNNTFVGTTSASSPTFTFTPGSITGVKAGANTLTVVATDMIYNTGTTSETITLADDGTGN